MHRIMPPMLLAALLTLPLSACHSSRPYVDEHRAQLDGRGDALRTLLDAEWENTHQRLLAGESVDPHRLYALAEIRMVLVIGQIANVAGRVDPSAAHDGRERIEWAQTAYQAYLAGQPNPPPPPGLH